MNSKAGPLFCMGIGHTCTILDKILLACCVMSGFTHHYFNQKSLGPFPPPPHPHYHYYLPTSSSISFSLQILSPSFLSFHANLHAISPQTSSILWLFLELNEIHQTYYYLNTQLNLLQTSIL